ncbi:MAG: CocE/NonD family hydrolase [Bacteroidota bacterium]
MKHILLVLFAFLTSVLGLNAQTFALDSAYIRDNYVKTEVLIPMRDGTRLFTSIYAPKDKSKTYPVLLKRTPYSCAPYGKDVYVSGFQNMDLARSGYIMVTQDVRGRYMSEGKFMDVRPFNPYKKTNDEIDEASDTYDTVDWLVKNMPGNNGKVGVFGISYPGFYSTMAILANHPAIKAVSPQAPVTDWFLGDDFHHNGAFCLMDAFSFYYAAGFGLPRTGPEKQHGRPFDWNSSDNYDFYLKNGALSNFKAKYIRDSVAFWDDICAHPDYDTWWQQRNPRPHLKKIQPAVLTVGGLFDAEDCFGAWKVYDAIEKQNPGKTSNRLVMGPWSHGGWARGKGEHLGNIHFGANTSEFYQKSIEFPFFEYYLKDQGNMALPEAYVFNTGLNQWKQFNTWPPAKTAMTRFYLGDKGTITSKIPPNTGQFDEYMSDPAKPVPYTEDVHLQRTREYMTDDQRFASRRPDVLVYETEVLQKEMTLEGPIKADLYVMTTGTDADFVVKLIDVFPDTMSGKENGVPMGGYQMLVRGEVMRARYRNSFEHPEALTPGVIEHVLFQLPDVSHTFLPGHRLMIQIQSSWFPLIDRNPQQFVNIYQCKDSDFIKATHRIYREAEHPSCIILPVFGK